MPRYTRSNGNAAETDKHAELQTRLDGASGLYGKMLKFTKAIIMIEIMMKLFAESHLS